MNNCYVIEVGNGYYSMGRVERMWREGGSTYVVSRSTNGKIFKTEKAVKDHLLKCSITNIDMSEFKVKQIKIVDTKPVNDWFDDKMLMKVMKSK